MPANADQKYRIVRYRDPAKGFDGYNWIEVPDGPWPLGGYFDGRGAVYATPFTKAAATRKAAELQDCEVVPL